MKTTFFPIGWVKHKFQKKKEKKRYLKRVVIENLGENIPRINIVQSYLFHDLHFELFSSKYNGEFNSKYESKNGKELFKFTPWIISSRMDDIESKYECLKFTKNRIPNLIEKMNIIYSNNPKEEVQFEEEFWELESLVNHFFNEARAILELITVLTKELYPSNNLPDNSFHKLIKEINIQIIEKFNPKLAILLNKVRREKWLNFLVNDEKLKKQSWYHFSNLKHF